MSELKTTQNTDRGFRRQLLTTVCALALLTSVSARDVKAADSDADRPTVWIELGGQLVHVSGQGDNFPVGFLAQNPNSPVLKPVSPLQAQNPPPFSFGGEGKVSFQPESSDWIFSAAVNYGRSSNFKHVDHQTNHTIPEIKYGLHPTTVANFADTQAHHRESHAILDFAVGKDVGLGLFGRTASSTLNFGVHYAQFSSQATFDVRARPDLLINYFYFGTVKVPEIYFHTYHATGKASRNFHGIGPSLSWNSSAPFAGNTHDGELTFDWGANAAILFGRQKTRVQHQESAHFKSQAFSKYYALDYQRSGEGHSTSRSVTVPNVGGFAGASWRIENFKASFGYRTDFFFGAIDGGIDTRKSENVGFYGPFATISVGLGG